MQPLFRLGQVVVTRAVHEWEIEDPSRYRAITHCIDRHQSGDFGKICKDDWDENVKAIQDGFRIFSTYEVEDRKLWIITEADRKSTTVLFPEDY